MDDFSELINEDNEEMPSRIVVHQGTIASWEIILKDGSLRDCLAKEYGILSFEMGVAGAVTGFPCLIIRGISDY
ncbi:hypothetical protein BGW36DRAFT_369121 [Talaromyces proteolyticus]|uniref:Nucleoside phosphorylase domain-containing protein n=1 Tax=Talaromyces proteolyticus TaxID=1131652 RepID=A0AAD4L325_9EURO|nr:uncharacterized protein BGW36DRAFT_369121 [Talaromyces proteolyticus]KAH8703303.1 hypothetical protein BGW36DRAFT_369121 [Talaromyces proteolyticus]